MLKNIIVGFVSAMAAFLTYVAMQPAAYSVARSVNIAAPPEVIFPHVNNLRKWNDWSPWAKKDPAAKHSYDGPESGEGARFAWSGNRDVGAGTMTIVASKPNTLVGLKLSFTEPMAGASDVTLALTPEGTGTKTTWSIQGEQGFIARAFMLAMGIKLEQMIGDDYEKGLANLKELVETRKPQ